MQRELLAKMLSHARYVFSILKRAEEHPVNTLRFLHRDANRRVYWKNTSVKREEFIAFVTRENRRNKIAELLEELRCSEFFQELTEKMSPMLARARVKTQRGWISYGLISDHSSGDFGAVLYLIVRSLKPEIVVETGVANGESSAFILGAMETNKQGRLYSIDLPPKQEEIFDDKASYLMPPGKKVGWLVSKSLRHRWTLILEPAEEALPHLVQHLNTIDIFLHDSLHTYNHMMFEFSTVWPHLRAGGVLLSDDVSGHRNPFHDFANKVSKLLFHYYDLGAIVK